MKYSRSRRDQPITYAKLYDSALRSLARREHGVAELREKLTQKSPATILMPAQSEGFSSEVQSMPLQDALDQLVHDLLEQNLLSDERFAEGLSRSRLNRGYGPYYIRQELNRKGIHADLVAVQLEQLEDLWAERAKEVVERRFSQARSNREMWGKAARFLQRRGFNQEHIQFALGRMPAFSQTTEEDLG